jgi:hypothetical protein
MGSIMIPITTTKSPPPQRISPFLFGQHVFKATVETTRLVVKTDTASCCGCALRVEVIPPPYFFGFMSRFVLLLDGLPSCTYYVVDTSANTLTHFPAQPQLCTWYSPPLCDDDESRHGRRCNEWYTRTAWYCDDDAATICEENNNKGKSGFVCTFYCIPLCNKLLDIYDHYLSPPLSHYFNIFLFMLYLLLNISVKVSF